MVVPYDGTFSGKLIDGSGVLAQALKDAGYKVIDAADAAMVSDDAVTVERTDAFVAFSPAEPVAGFIFYPGGKFGSYGTQSGDGEATISAEEQTQITADLLAAWMAQ